MRTAALLSFWGFTVIAFAVRTAVQKLTTGDGGLRGIARDRGPLAVVAGLLLVPAWLTVGVAPVLSRIAPWPPALTVTATGAALGFWTQWAMGRSWRIGVASGERTRLVTDGPFRWVRNPFFTGMALVAIGTTATVPTWLGAAGTLLLCGTLVVQVRLVEEPHLARAFGPDYAAYSLRAGRFIPGIGRGPIRPGSGPE